MAVSDAEGRDPTDLPPLHGAIDPDALDALFEGSAEGDRSEVSVVFSYCGYEVSVSGDGDVTLSEPGA